ncbi:sensor histidine kinase [Brevibacillus agri]|uniref:sensor histidine kinase n=1 Tax=Brevibacillus agri TaxID=51101 RepID=UPI001C8E8097|nr:GHKL domain-containing protein [Brevibacillus agri]MBY0050728.1 GHKL domain-containing protein [Brevibacillus agri]MED3499098.1 GHKL domain-containing protein [Brevibacillus agri]WHX30246.1 GHKL domain-containing protein [Brevibacillus agri]
MDFLLRFLLVDIPEAFLLLTISLALFNLSVFEKKKQAILFSLLFALTGELLTLLEVLYQPKVILMFLCMTAYLILLYRFNILKSVFMGTIALVVMILAESIILAIFNSQQLFLEEILSTTMLAVFARLFYLGVFLTIAIVLRTTKFDIHQLFQHNRLNRYLFLLILLGSVEFLLILFMNTSFFLRENNSAILALYTPQFQMFFQLAILALFIVIVVLFRIYLNLTINRVEEETGTPYLNSIQDLFTAVRSIKHDSLNHYTAINGFLKKELHSHAKEYVEQLLKETVLIERSADSSSQVLERIKNPAVASLLQSKMVVCLAERISLTLEIKEISQFSHYKTYDLIKILGNLLDNAIRATSYELEENRYIRLEWGQTENEHFLYIENSGPTIPECQLQEIFQMGYTTKKNGEGGLGLAIVKNVAERYNGNIQVKSADGITSFFISFANR